MKQLLTTIAAVVLMGCGETNPQVSIHYAASDGNLELVKEYLEAGGDVNSTEKTAGRSFGVTILHSAVEGGQKQIVKLLIEKGADINATEFGNTSTITGWDFGPAIGQNSFKLIGALTPLDWANDPNEDDSPDVKEAKKEIATLLNAKGGKTSVQFSIHTAVANGDAKAVKKHLESGVSVNAKDLDTLTPLHFAALLNKTEIAELLISEGSDVNAKEDYYYTPLDLADPDLEIADLLRKHGGKTGEELKAEEK